MYNQDLKYQQVKVEALTQEHNRDFLQSMLSRMDMSYMKYGRFRANYVGQYSDEFLGDVRLTLTWLISKWQSRIADSTNGTGNALLGMLSRILAYVNSKNTEHLIDAANSLMIEFSCPQVPEASFKPSDSDGSKGFPGAF